VTRSCKKLHSGKIGLELDRGRNSARQNVVQVIIRNQQLARLESCKYVAHRSLGLGSAKLHLFSRCIRGIHAGYSYPINCFGPCVADFSLLRLTLRYRPRARIQIGFHIVTEIANPLVLQVRGAKRTRHGCANCQANRPEHERLPFKHIGKR
jgi:hypothetical protein